MRRLVSSLPILVLASLGIVLTIGSPAQAQDEDPGSTSGTGTSFTTSGPAGDFSFSTTDSVTAAFMTMPDEFIEFVVVGIAGVDATDLTISGLTPGHRYWMYTNAVVDPFVFDASSEGTYTVPLDVSAAVERWIQPGHSTLLLMENGLEYAAGGSFIGATWDAVTQTATLTDDVSETIRILQAGATLDGAGHCTSAQAPYGIRAEAENVTIENVAVYAQNIGVTLRSGATLRDSRIEVDPYSTGVWLPEWLTNVRCIPHPCPPLDPPTDAGLVTGCEITARYPFQWATRVTAIDGVSVYHNNFFVSDPIRFGSLGGNVWSDPVLGGNYWGDLYTGIDADGDGFGDTSYTVTLGDNVDYFPFVDPIPLDLPSCDEAPATIAISGAVTSDCDGPIGGVAVSLTLGSGEVLDTVTDAAGSYSFEADAGSGPATVAIAVPGGYDAQAASVGVALDADAVVDFPLTCIYVDVTGNVSSDCDGPALVAVDLTYGGNFLTTSTDANGDFLFEHLRWTQDPAEISIVVPLGMVALSPEFGHAAIALTDDVTEPFSLQCLATTGDARSMGYWKHQARVHLYGKGSAQESYDDMATNFPAAIYSHFYENELNAIDVPGVSSIVTGGGTAPIDLSQIEQTLTVNHGGTLLDRAKQQFLAALLNVASGKIATWTVVSEDGFTASQAIQDVADRINDGDPGNDELAKDIAEALNLGEMVAAGSIRDQWNDIRYKGAAPPSASSYGLEQNGPNPFNPQTTIRFQLPEAMSYELTVYNTAGQVVDRIRAKGQRGTNVVVWNGKNGSVASGVYLYTLRAGDFQQTRRMVLVK